MALHCTLFPVRDTEIEPPRDQTLPGYDDLSSTQPGGYAAHLLELGSDWRLLYAALGGHGSDHPLSFLAGGGRQLSDVLGSTSRHFDRAETVRLLAAVAKLRIDVVPAEHRRTLERLRQFLAKSVESGRGVIVIHFD